MNRWMKKSLTFLLLMLLSVFFSGCSVLDQVLEEVVETPGISEEIPGEEPGTVEEEPGETEIREDGYYTSKEDVALYLHIYGKLPGNFITKREAENLGWEASKGNLWEVTEKKSIGGDRFGNREGLLPNTNGRKWFECDIDYEGGFRNEKRIVYSSDGLIYYTGNHYESFTQLYDAEGAVQ
jgi:ribonuclease T1